MLKKYHGKTMNSSKISTHPGIPLAYLQCEQNECSIKTKKVEDLPLLDSGRI